MSSLFRIGQTLKGAIGTYTIAERLQETAWLAKNQMQRSVVIKSSQAHSGVTNERNVLKKFQHRTPYIRAMIDEIQIPDLPVTIALEHLDSNIWDASAGKALNRNELKHVSRCVLEALKTLHDGGYVHADVKSDNVFVNLQEADNRFGEMKLGDMGNCSPIDSEGPTSGAVAGSPTWSSPEIMCQIPWNTAADIWAFGALVVHMMYGSYFNLCTPQIQRDEEEDGLEFLLLDVFLRQLYWFGPLPDKIVEVANEEVVDVIATLKEHNMPAQQGMFKTIPESELSKKDNEFIRRIMKLDWRDRPSAKELLEDQWWNDE